MRVVLLVLESSGNLLPAYLHTPGNYIIFLLFLGFGHLNLANSVS